MLGQMSAAEDEREVRFLMAHYVHYLDAAAAEEWANLFTDDGTWVRRNAAPVALGGSGIEAGVLTGRKALADLVRRSIDGNFRRLSRHMITDLLLWRADLPDRMQGRCRMLITDWREGPGRIAMIGDYELAFANTPDGWRIARLEAHFLPR